MKPFEEVEPPDPYRRDPVILGFLRRVWSCAWKKFENPKEFLKFLGDFIGLWLVRGDTGLNINAENKPTTLLPWDPWDWYNQPTFVWYLWVDVFEIHQSQSHGSCGTVNVFDPLLTS